MKIKHLILGLSLGAAFLGGCNYDDLSQVGTSIQGEEDKISVTVDTFRFEASTVLMESIYAKTDTGLLGEIYDPLYGTLKTDYICQFYCPEGFKFRYTPIDGKIDSVDFRIFYNSWVGDSLAPMRAQIFPVVKALERNYYTDIVPEDYCDMQNPLGAHTYTPFDMSVPDSIRYETNSNGQYVYFPYMSIRMPKELGQSFYEETINNPASFANQDSFNEFFPGLYITNTFGSGNILGVSLSYFTIYYKHMLQDVDGNDSIARAQEVFNVTKEVIQLNRFKNTDMSHLLENNDEFTYMKTPAGICTRLVIPAAEIEKKVKGRILNDMPLTLYDMPQQDEYNFSPTPPTSLLLLPEDSVATFFENGKIYNLETSFVSTYTASKRSHSFGNISNILKHQMENAPGEDLRLLAIPIKAKYSSNYYGQTYVSGISHFLFPSALKLRKDDDVMKVAVTSSKYGTTK